MLDYDIFEELDNDKTRLFLVDTYLKAVGELSYELILRDYETALRTDWPNTWFHNDPDVSIMFPTQQTN